MEARHAEAHTAHRHAHRQLSLTLASTGQDTCDPHLQHTTLPVISPTSFQNWTPASWSLNKKCNGQIIRNTIGAQCSAFICRWRYVWFFTNTFLVCTNNGRNPRIGNCSFIDFLRVCFEHNSALNKKRQQTVEKVTYHWCLAHKIGRLSEGESGEGGSYLRCYPWSIGAPQSGEWNATYGRRKELPPIIRKENRYLSH